MLKRASEAADFEFEHRLFLVGTLMLSCMPVRKGSRVERHLNHKISFQFSYASTSYMDWI